MCLSEFSVFQGRKTLPQQQRGKAGLEVPTVGRNLSPSQRCCEELGRRHMSCPRVPCPRVASPTAVVAAHSV